MSSARGRRDPIPALTLIESAGVVLAAATDAYLLWLSRFAAMIDPVPDVIFIALFACTTAAVFCVPHERNRRFAAIAAAVALLAALASVRPYGITPIVLAAVLAARLTFAFGVSGTVIAWLAACATIGFRMWSQSRAMQVPLSFPLLAYSLCVFAVLIGLAFGLIAVYARFAARSAAFAASEERGKIALELHDAVGHSLTTLNVQLENARRYRAIDPAKADEYLERAASSAQQLLTDVRETVGVLHDGRSGESVALGAMVERLLSDFAATHQVRIDSQIDLPSDPPGRIGIAVYRVLQEALTNVARHAGATALCVRLACGPRELVFSVEDDGAGMRDAGGNGHGLTSMRRRIEELGGAFAVRSSAGKGTAIEGRVPLESS
jgi:signal transduction histidine kinase